MLFGRWVTITSEKKTKTNKQINKKPQDLIENNALSLRPPVKLKKKKIYASILL